ncbi:hypothetical protein SAMN05421678_102298 [Actinopolymorpha cephalotaxi]|uniref:WxL domain surface cell wall-binding n=1 Tax=Actinopolymorpha cephalotaxi TaxID=504797 RepID=A0A1I2LSR3_9ACTN|nr:hypothetical protein [Actinopolymorpha cephalotaxi]NYH81437.1 hypothetical protein [Actinopolymorpha cephalotaxi]SFF82364.1 hypothetical protein SAMN05421678_102298 [Actinopolymorpha cephalotaxi]
MWGLKVSKRSLGLPLLAVAGLATALLTAQPAQAATCPASTTCPTTVTFGVNQGNLTIAVPAGPISLGNGNPGDTISNTFTGGGGSAVTVSDQRASTTPNWTALASSTNFTGDSTGAVIPNGDVFYASGIATSTTGNGTFTPGQATPPGQALDGVQLTAYSHSGGSGNNSATWNPTITINIPADAVADVYRGTVNHSVG